MVSLIPSPQWLNLRRMISALSTQHDFDFNSTQHDLRANLDTQGDAKKLDLHMDKRDEARPLNADTPPILEHASFALDAIISDTSD